MAFAMFAVIFIASLLPTEHLPQSGNDKLHHFVSYAVLAWWSTLVFSTLSIKQLLILALKLIVFGGIIEVLQGLSGYRYAEWYDLLANSLGVSTGALIAYYLTKDFLVKIDNYLSQ